MFAAYQPRHSAGPAGRPTAVRARLRYVLITSVLLGAGVAGCQPDQAGPGRAGTTGSTGSTGSPPGVSPATTGAPQPSGGALVPASQVDWLNATVTLPANATGCASGPGRFRSGTGEVGSTRYRMGHWVSGVQRESAARYADVTGDGVTDAVLVLDCTRSEGWAANPPEVVLVVSGAADRPTLPPVVSVPPRSFDDNGASMLSEVTAAPGVVRWQSQNWEGTGGGRFEARWNGTEFTVTARQ